MAKKKEETKEVEKIEPAKVEKEDEKISIKDYKFPIILLAVVLIFSLCVPLIFSGIKNLEESNFWYDLFHPSKKAPVEEQKEKEKLVIENSDKSGANAPELKEGMIPVRYNYISKQWVKANVENPYTNSWYNYNSREWANAIIVKDNGTNNRDYYKNAAPDTVINNEDILAFFVWIPRFKYSMVSSTGMQQIDIVFESKTTPKSVGPNYITHPAFTFGDQELNGFWISKFEVTGQPTYLTSLPYSSPVTNVNIATMFNTLPGFKSTYYGLSDDSEIKLIKNTEWGAVSYLAASKYGVCKNSLCPVQPAYTSDYNSESGMLSSTTKNVNGVFAMNGSVEEYVMGNSSNPSLSGFDNVWLSANKKYYDVYTSGESNNYSRGLTGDATKELEPFESNLSKWNYGFAIFINDNNPWFVRGSNNSMYSFNASNGAANSNIGFRITIN